jgi:Zn-dependent protease with chaperone function
MLLHRWTTRLAAACVAIAGLAGCVSTESVTRGGATGVDSKSLMLVDAEQLNHQSAMIYREMMMDARVEGRLNSNPHTTDRLQRIGDELIRHVAVFRDDAPGWEWDINVISSPELNAFCMPGGKIAFYTGIIDRLNLTDDEIAAIMGHEIAHALREHSRARVSRAIVGDFGTLVLGNVLATDASMINDLVVLRQLLSDLPYSRKHETEADIMGLELAARAGFNPEAAVRVWQKMAAEGGSSVPEFQSTHPSHATRINTIRSNLHIVRPLYADGAGSPVPVIQPESSAAAEALRADAYQDERDSFKQALATVDLLKKQGLEK